MLTLLVIVSISVIKANLGFHDAPSFAPLIGSQDYSLSHLKPNQYKLTQHRNHEPPASTFKNASTVNELSNLMFDLQRAAQQTGVACPADVLFVLDATGSMRNVFKQCLVYITKVLEGLTISTTVDRVGVILYSSSTRKKEKIPLGSINDPGTLVKSIKALPFFSGITSTGAALKMAAHALKARRPNVRANVIVITDGFSCDITDEYATNLRHMPNVTLFAVAIGESYVRKELEIIAGSPDNTLYGPSSYGKLVKLIKTCHTQSKTQWKVETTTPRYIKTVTDSQGRHLIPIPLVDEFFPDKSSEDSSGYESTNLWRNNLESSGWNGPSASEAEVSSVLIGQKDSEGSVDVTHTKPEDDSPNVARKRQSIDVFNSFDNEDEAEQNIETFSKTPYCKYDIVLVFDSSGSLQGSFEDQLAIANRLVDKVALSSKGSQIAAINYAGNGKSRVVFDFKDIVQKNEVKKRIAGIQFLSGTTNTNEALLRTASVFAGPGARPNKAKPVAIVFTDGFSAVDPTEGARLLHKMGVLVFAIGMDKDNKLINRKELEVIAGDPLRVYTMSNIFQFVHWVGKICL